MNTNTPELELCSNNAPFCEHAIFNWDQTDCLGGNLYMNIILVKKSRKA